MYIPVLIVAIIKYQVYKMASTVCMVLSVLAFMLSGLSLLCGVGFEVGGGLRLLMWLT